MPLVSFKTVPPYHQVAVNPATVFAVAPEPSTPGDDCELLADGPRQIMVLEPLQQAAQKLGPAFVRFDAASTTIATVYVNKALAFHVQPHPQVPGVVQISGQSRMIPVKGTLDQVAQQLA